jgi:enoyl-CoA hydratase/carnithine racemase
VIYRAFRSLQIAQQPDNSIMGGPVSSATIDLPSSYTSLNTTQIIVSHVPASSPTPTPVVVVTLNRPKNYNAFTKVMEEELVRVFEMFDLDDRVRCVVLNGAGKMFCAGADLDIGFKSQKEREREGEHRDGFVTSKPQLT